MIQCLFSIALLLQYYGIRICYDSYKQPVQIAYRRIVLCIAGISLQHPLTVITVGLIFHCPVSGFSRFTLYADFSTLQNHGGRAVLFIVSLTAIRLLTSFSWLLVTIPPFVLQLVRMESIPISRFQKQWARFTCGAGILFLVYQCVNLLITITLDVAEQSVSAGLQRVQMLLTNGSVFIFYCIYLFLCAWFMHIVSIKVLTGFPEIRKIFYRVTCAAAVICAWVLAIRTVRSLDGYGISVPAVSAYFLNKPFFPFYEDLMLYGLFAFSGLYVLHCEARKQFRANSVKEQSAASDLAAAPLNTGPFFTTNGAMIEDTEQSKQHYRHFFLDCGLTEREAEVAVLITLAKSNKEIAIELHIAYNTVRNHVANVYKKTGTHNRFELARFGRLCR
ncbi:MAG: helix-turn-helix transcriptional regulator [Treponema sp.]